MTMSNQQQAGWEWANFEKYEYHFNQLDEVEQKAMLKQPSFAERKSNRMSFDDLIASLQQHTNKQGI
jgi:hypothetical protein